MGSVACIVCESTGRWAAALGDLVRSRRRADAEAPDEALAVRFVEVRTLNDCRSAWREAAARGLARPLIVEVSAAGAAGVCELLADHRREIGRAPRMVVADRSDGAYDGIVREAGATAFVTSPRELNSLTEMLLRFAELPEAQPAAWADDKHPLDPFRSPAPSSPPG